MMALHQLRIFWTVAQAESLTRAGKQLSLSQPSLSQQLAKLEEAVGAQLFDRKPGQMELTDAGRFLLRKAELILAGVDEATTGLQEYACGSRAYIGLAGLNSVMRVLVPQSGAAKLGGDGRAGTAHVPLDRYGEPVEVTNAILFLASGEASYITGTELVVDGGITAG